MKIEMPVVFRNSISNGYSYVQDETAILIDRLFQILDIKILSALLFLAAISLGIASVWIQHSPQNVVFTPEQISYLTLPDTRLQSTFYTFFCIAIFGFFITAGLLFPNWFQRSNSSDRQVSAAIPQWLKPWVGILFWVVILLAYEPKARDFLLALVVAYLMAETIKGRFRTGTIAMVLLLVISIICIFPLGFQHEIGVGRLWTMDIHWSAVLGDGLYTHTFAGSETAAFANYGVFLNGLIAVSRQFPFFETLGGTLTFLKFINLVFCGLIVIVIAQRVGLKNKRMIGATALLILIIFSGMISGVAETFDTPNLLPVRFIMIPVTVILAYLLAGRKGCAGSIIFGLVAPLLVLYNFETSIYCILAMGFALFIESARKGLLNVIFSGAAFALGFLLSGSILMLVLFDSSLGTIFGALIQIMALKVQSGSSGFAGLPVYFFPPFIVIMIHSGVLFSRYLLSLKEGEKLSSVDFQSIVIVGLIIAIGPYVMNRFHILNMWVPFLLYALLVLPKLVVGAKTDRVLWSFMLIVFVIPFIFGNPVRRLVSKDFVAAVSDKVDGNFVSCLNGIKASNELCAYTLEKAAELKNLETEYSGLEWMSGLSLNMMRLTGTQPVLTQKAPFFFGHREETRNILVSTLRQNEAPFIALDNAAAGNVAGIPPVVERFQRNLLRDAGYSVIGETKYWILTRKQIED